MNYQPKINDVFYLQWDHSPEFFQVIEISKTGKTVTLQRIQDMVVGKANLSQQIFKPILNSFEGKPIRKKINNSCDGCISFPTRNAYLVNTETVIA